MNNSFDEFLKNIEEKSNCNDIDNYIKEFNNNNFDKSVTFYSKLLELVKKEENSSIRIKAINIIRDNIKDISINDYNSYFLFIDITMLLGIEYYLINNNDKAKYYFDIVVEFGEKYKNYSKKNYYDIINCAYSWLVYYSYNDKNYDKVKEYCNKVLSNYNEVKDDPDYNITEKESVSICLNYLDSIKKE